MRTAAVFLCLVITAAPCFAGSTSHIVIAGSTDRVVSPSLVRQADFFACAVSIISERKEPGVRFRDMQAVKNAILAAAGNDPKIIIHSGPVFLSGERKSLFSKLSSYGTSSYS